MARVRRYLGRVEVWLDKGERAAVLAIVDRLADDPKEGRWLTHRGYDDPELDREYRRLTAPEVDALHEADVAVLREDLSRGDHRTRLDEDRALTWLRALNRLRLVAGSRLGIENDGWEAGLTGPQLEGEDFAMMNDLGWLQEGILTALDR